MRKSIAMGTALAVVVFATFAFMLPFNGAVAAGNAAPKATGGVGYNAYGLERHADFSAIQTSNTCSYANVTGAWKIDFAVGVGAFDTNLYDLTLTQTGTDVTGLGQYPSPGPYAYAWTAVGSVDGNNISLTDTYTLGAIGTVMTMTGTIASDGTMSGTWSDNYAGGRTGIWKSVTGNAAVATGCTGKSTFNYSDANGNYYAVSVQYVNVNESDAWFAGPVISGNVGAGEWLFAKVHDGGTPGRNGDQIWGSFTTEGAAKSGVALMTTPGDGPFNVTSGNLVVH